MKYLTLLLVLAISACANTPTSISNNLPEPENGYYRVMGTGKNFEEARLDGFKLAVEKAVGSIVVTEKLANNNILIRDQIVLHSSGYVDDFKIIERSGSNISYRVIMDVKVKSSQIANIILGTTNKAGRVDSNRVYGQYDSINQERKEAESLINNLLDSFPRKSFKIDIKPMRVKLDDNRDMLIEIDSTISWNEAWLNNLIETFNRVKDNDKTTRRKIDVVKNPSDFDIFNNKTTLYINDEQIFRKAFDTLFITLYPVIEIVDKNGNWIIRGCASYPNYGAIGDVKPTHAGARYTIPKNSQTFENLKQMDHVNIYMTTNYNVCKNKV